jgi:hypothetical protein
MSRDLVGYGGGSYPMEEQAQAKMARMPTMKERIELAVVQAEDRLAKAKRAKELFEKNPDLEELLNIMQGGHF